VTHAYATGGTYTVRLIVSDPLTLADTVFTTATVLTQADASANAKALLDQLVSDAHLSAGTANSLTSKIDAAIAAFGSGLLNAGANQLQSLLNQLDALVSSGRLSASDAAALRTLVNRIIESAS
jgi:PKD repeat protein